jgi:hypothetical protein
MYALAGQACLDGCLWHDVRFPLLRRDGLTIAYIGCLLLFAVLAHAWQALTFIQPHAAPAHALQ